MSFCKCKFAISTHHDLKISYCRVFLFCGTEWVYFEVRSSVDETLWWAWLQFKQLYFLCLASSLGKAPASSTLLQLELNILKLKQIGGWSYKTRSVRSELPEDGNGGGVAIARALPVGGDVQQVCLKIKEYLGIARRWRFVPNIDSNVMARKIPRSVVCHLLQLLDRRSLAVMAQVSRTFR